MLADVDGMYFVGEEKEGSVQVKYLCPVGGRMNRFNWPAIEDIFDTSVDDVSTEEIGVAHHNFLKCTKD